MPRYRKSAEAGAASIKKRTSCGGFCAGTFFASAGWECLAPAFLHRKTRAPAGSPHPCRCGRHPSFSGSACFLITHWQVLPILPISLSKPRKTIPLPAPLMIKCYRNHGFLYPSVPIGMRCHHPLPEAFLHLKGRFCPGRRRSFVDIPSPCSGSETSHGNLGGLFRCPEKCLASILMPIR